MDINLTFFGEILTFGVLIFVTLKFIWPPLTKAMKEREEKIAAGLVTAERAKHDLEFAQNAAKDLIREANHKVKHVTDRAEQEALAIIESGKNAARNEGAKIISYAHTALENERRHTECELEKRAVEIGMQAAEKILKEKIDPNTDRKLIDQFIKELAEE